MRKERTVEQCWTACQTVQLALHGRVLHPGPATLTSPCPPTRVYVPAGLYPSRPPGTFCWLKAAKIDLKGSSCDNGKPGCVSGVVSRAGYVQDLTWKPTFPSANHGEPTGVASCAVGPNGTVYVGQRSPTVHPILSLNHQGVVTGGFGDKMVKSLHGMQVQKVAGGTTFLWTTDSANATVSKWDPVTGTRITAIGGKGTAVHPVQFGSVADAAFDQAGMVYLSDGDGGINARVLKLNPALGLVWANGNNGTVASNVAWASPHSLAYDGVGHRVVVADRNNNRLRFLDADSGVAVGEWPPSVFALGDCALPSVWSVRIDSAARLIFVGVSNFGSGAGCPPPAAGDTQAAIKVFQVPPPGAVPATADVATTIPVEHGFPHEICLDASTGAVYSAAVDSADLPTGTGLGAVTRYIPS
jgi:hypothetical protein